MALDVIRMSALNYLAINMRKIQINTPIWITKSVGIDERLIDQDIEVEILYQNLNGKRSFPGKYRMTKERALAYPSRKFGHTPMLKVIPISAFENVIK